MTANDRGALIAAADKRSPAGRAGIAAGERLIFVNGEPVRDILDVVYCAYDCRVTLTVAGADGVERTVTVDKREGEDIGLSFDDNLFDGMKTCANKCVFCFIDQNPPGMRDTIYGKDDDTRLSVLTGSYITLTNLTDSDVARIAGMRISPIHVSVHTTDSDLRCTMLKNRFAGESLRHLKSLSDAGIELHGQIVICPGYNDGERLTQTLNDLQAYRFASVSVVPVGLTKHRSGLPPLRPVDATNARDIIARCEPFDRVYCADELYLTAGLPLPEEDAYGGFPQLDNGVGMLASFRADFRRHLPQAKWRRKIKPFTLVTGEAAAPFFRELLTYIPCDNGQVAAIENDFYGRSVTVAGLVTGSDIIAQLRGGRHERLLIPSLMLRHEQDMFLDGVTPRQIAEAIGCPVQIVPNDAAALISAIQKPRKYKV